MIIENGHGFSGILKARSENGCEKDTIITWTEIGSGFGEPGGTPPPRIPPRIPRRTPQGLTSKVKRAGL